MMTKPFGYKVRAEDFSEASTSKQKPKHLKPIPYVFHTMVNADGISVPELDHSSTSASSSMICEAAITPPIPEIEVLNISDKKRHREGDDEADSPTSSKRLKLIPELTIADFPEHALNLELLPEDLMDGDDNLEVHPITDSTSLGMEVRPQGPPPPG
ncbi:hypothetical protein LINGRAHAP2_LOCUS16076 [Linum grandiflorum]